MVDCVSRCFRQLREHVGLEDDVDGLEEASDLARQTSEAQAAAGGRGDGPGRARSMEAHAPGGKKASATARRARGAWGRPTIFVSASQRGGNSRKKPPQNLEW